VGGMLVTAVLPLGIDGRIYVERSHDQVTSRRNGTHAVASLRGNVQGGH
jgi:hypothetical protein